MYGYRKHEDIKGQRFTHLYVVELAPKKEFGHKGVLWNCICDCGKTIIVTTQNLKSGNTKSCGCLQQKMRRKYAKLKHCITETKYNESLEDRIIL